MAQNRSQGRLLGWPVVLALLLLLIVIAGFLVAVAASGSAAPGTEPLLPTTEQSTPQSATLESDEARVLALVAQAHPENADGIAAHYGCLACHRDGGGSVAPSWVGIAERAASRRPPLPAAAYLYESIVDPAAYVVEGYADLMPRNFGKRMNDQELADVIAYLLTTGAH